MHEEEDASTTAKALGFIIDGDQLRVHPVPEKRDKVISVLRWLSQRPKVTGKCIERIVGHCIHFFMLKRELLSIFRSVYDFKTAHYSSPSRLWRTAADECRWAADLLWICESDLAKEWSGHATVSDACLTGTATCALNLNSLQAHSIGANRELWRYKGSTISIKARDVVQKLDPFCDVRTVFDPGLVNDPFQLNSEFQNVPYHIACSDEWKFQFSSRMKMKEHITILEGRATVQSIRHKCRSSQHFNKHHLHFGDNLGMVLAFDRGRAKSIPLLLCCRRAAAFSIACGCQFHHRWVPSEWNAADGPSRRWEQTAHGEKCSKRSTEKVISEIIYPTTAKAQSKAIARVAKGLGHSGPQGRSSFGNTKLQTAVHESSQKVGSRQGPRGQETEETIQPLSREEIQQTDGTGSLCSKSSNPSRLSSSCHGVSRILQATSPENCNSFSGRPVSDPVSELLLSRGAGRFRSKPVLRSSDGVLSNSGKDKFGQESASFEGWRNLDPGQQRTPLAWPLVSIIALTLMRLNQPTVALCILTMFNTYIRPSEALKLRKQDVVRTSNLGLQWAINLNSSDEAETSKVGMEDESILLDNPMMNYLGPALHRLSLGLPSAPLPNLKYADLIHWWRTALMSIGLAQDFAVLYQLRHSGASWDRLKKTRTTLEIKLRGRWSSDASLRRYDSHAKVAQLYEKLPVKVKKQAEASPPLLKAMVIAFSTQRFPMV